MSGDEVPLRWRWLNAIKATPPADARWTPGALGVALALWAFADETGGGIYPGDARLAGMAGCSVSQVERLRRIVLKLGLIERVRMATSASRAAEYRLVEPALWVSPDTASAAPAPTPPVSERNASRCSAHAEVDGVEVWCVRLSGHAGGHYAA